MTTTTRRRARLHTRTCNECRGRLNNDGMPLHGHGTVCPDCWVRLRTARYEARLRAAVAGVPEIREVGR